MILISILFTVFLPLSAQIQLGRVDFNGKDLINESGKALSNEEIISLENGSFHADVYYTLRKRVRIAHYVGYYGCLSGVVLGVPLTANRSIDENGITRFNLSSASYVVMGVSIACLLTAQLFISNYTKTIRQSLESPSLELGVVSSGIGLSYHF